MMWLGAALFRGVASAQAFEGGSLETARFRAMGGVNVANDPRTPANAALGATDQTVLLEAHAGSSLSDGIDALQKAGSILALQLSPQSSSATDLAAYAAEIQELTQLLDGKEYALRADLRVDLIHYITPVGESGSFEMGIYQQATGWGIARAPGQTDSMVYTDASGPFVNLGQDVELLRMGARGQLGGYLGLGRRIGFAHGRALGLGVRVRGFAEAYVPPAVATAPARVYGPDSVTLEHADSFELGFGFAVDLYATAALADRAFDTRLALRAESAPGYVSVGDAQGAQQPAIGVGVMLRPLHAAGADALEFGVDVENATSGAPMVQLGLSYTVRAGRWFMLKPMLGAQMGRDGVLPIDRGHALTGGIETVLGPVWLAGALSVASDGSLRDLAASAGIGF